MNTKNHHMLKSYFKIAWRNLVHNKFFSSINIFGLSAGLACCMLIALYLHYETSYDRYHKNIGDLYQVGTTFITKGEKQNNVYRTPAPMAWALKKEFPEVVTSTRLLGSMDDKTLFTERLLPLHEPPHRPRIGWMHGLDRWRRGCGLGR